ncbi:MAG: cytochrome c [Acidobacteria bacterium]|nr:cytochrome c [Acidobacteriota bacterium]
MMIKKMALLLTVLFVLAPGAARPQAQNHTTSEPAFKSLHQLMEEGIHERFTFVSFTLWHDTPMTPEKLETIAASAMELRQLADTIPTYSPKQLQVEGAKEDLRLFATRAAELSSKAQKLAETAALQDVAATETAFKQVEASCQACHNRFHQSLRNQ